MGRAVGERVNNNEVLNFYFHYFSGMEEFCGYEKERIKLQNSTANKFSVLL
jgi:hypothetical protein